MSVLDLDFFKIEHNNIDPEKGKVLISEPFLQDTYFKRSVVLLTEHNEDGSIGFVLNNPIDFSLDEILKNFPDFEANISLGGPVSTSTVHFIHSLGKLIPDGQQVSGNIQWGGDFDEITTMIKAGLINKNQIRFFVGYSSWYPDQLNKEISENSWVVSELSDTDIMEKSEKDMWKYSVKSLGKKYKRWMEYPENPNFN
ncbi:YqgE/AlgH family protein [Bacteroidota bacterium]